MDEPKRILILTANAGFGHRSASNAVATALQKTYGDQVQVDILNPLDDKRTSILLRDSQTDYDKIVRAVPELYKFGYEVSDSSVPTSLVESALVLMLYDVLHDVLKRYEPDAIVITYPLYQAPLDAIFTITRRRVPLITVVTDLATVHRLWFHNAADLCLVPTDVVRDLAVGAGLPPSRVKITGIPVDPDLGMGTQSKAELRAGLGLDPQRITLLAVGSRRVERLPETLNILNHSGLPLQMILVAGGDDDLYQRFNETEWHIPVKIFNYVDHMPDLMKPADAIICKAGGLIVTEALACGLPILLVEAIPGQEIGNAEFVVHSGAGVMAQSATDAMETVFHWMQNDGAGLKECARNARRVGRPEAAFDVSKYAWEMAHLEHVNHRKSRKERTRPSMVDFLTNNHINVKESRRSRVRKQHEA
jgi:1,2-diacylglycerol 3-beta-galactosyltransferase